MPAPRCFPAAKTRLPPACPAMLAQLRAGGRMLARCHPPVQSVLSSEPPQVHGRTCRQAGEMIAAPERLARHHAEQERHQGRGWNPASRHRAPRHCVPVLPDPEAATQRFPAAFLPPAQRTTPASPPPTDGGHRRAGAPSTQLASGRMTAQHYRPAVQQVAMAAMFHGGEVCAQRNAADGRRAPQRAAMALPSDDYPAPVQVAQRIGPRIEPLFDHATVVQPRRALHR
jgi:hypothetical protein